MRFLFGPCCGSSTYRSTSTLPPLPVVSEHQPDEASRRKRARRRISRSMSSVDWQPSLASIYEDDLTNTEVEGEKNKKKAGCDDKKNISSVSVAKLNGRSHSFDVNDLGRQSSLPSMNSEFCGTPFMI